jgi:hypothetical protein
LTKGPDGQLLSAITGEETDDELRELIFCLAERCPVGKKHPHCPFCMLGGLSLNSLRTYATSLNRRALLDLFDLERNCRNYRPALPCGSPASQPSDKRAT